MADISYMSENNLTNPANVTSDDESFLLIQNRMEAFGPMGQTILVCLYSLVALLAFTGNMLVIFVEIYGKRSARNLQKFLINLAISDLLIGVLSVPFNYTDIMLGRWIFHPVLCPIAQFVQLMSVLVSTYTLTFIGIERYFATLHPLSSANTWLRSHYNLVLMMGWIIGSLLASISMKNVQVVDFVYKNETYQDCKHWVGLSEQDMKIYVSTSFVLTFVLPMTFLTFSYGAIGRRLLRAQQHWCQFKQTAPFSLHTASRTQSSANSNCSATLNGPSTRIANAKVPADQNSASNNGQSATGAKNNHQFIRCNKAVIKVSRTRSNQSLDSDGKSHHRQKMPPVKMYSSDHHSQENNLPPDANNTSKVFIRFDRRNTEFLNKMRVFRLLVAVLVLFILCWLPIKIFMLVLAFWPSIVDIRNVFSYYVYYVTYFTCHLLSMSNSFANPVLYCFLSKSFRADLIDLFVCISTKLHLSPSATSTKRTNQPATPQTYHHHNNHFHYNCNNSVRLNHTNSNHNIPNGTIANNNTNNNNNNNSKLASIRETKAEPKSIKVTDHRSHSSRHSSSSVSGVSDTYRSNGSRSKSKHSKHSNASRHSARSSIFDDL